MPVLPWIIACSCRFIKLNLLQPQSAQKPNTACLQSSRVAKQLKRRNIVLNRREICRFQPLEQDHTATQWRIHGGQKLQRGNSSFNQLQVKKSGKAGRKRKKSSKHNLPRYVILGAYVSYDRRLTNSLINWSVELPWVKYGCSELRHVCIHPAFLWLSTSVYTPVNAQTGKRVMSKIIWQKIVKCAKTRIILESAIWQTWVTFQRKQVTFLRYF